MLHTFYLIIINILTHVCDIQEKGSGEGGIQKWKKMVNLICERQKKSKTTFKIFLISINKLGTIYSYKIEM